MKRIMVIEDERGMNKALEDALKRAKYEYDWATSGNDAYSRLSSEKYDLIILDIMMVHGEGKNIPEEIMRRQMGLYILQELRRGTFENKGGASGNIPVIVVSAITNADDINEIEKLTSPSGFYFQKPVRPSEVIKKAEEILGK